MTNAHADSQLSAIIEKVNDLDSRQIRKLVELLEDRLAADPAYYPDWHRQAVREAAAELDAKPDSAIPFEDSLRNAREAVARHRASQQ